MVVFIKMMKIDERTSLAIEPHRSSLLAQSLIRLRFVEFEKNKEPLVIGLGLSIAAQPVAIV